MKAMRKIPKGQRPRAGRGLAQELTATAKALRDEGVSEKKIEVALMSLCGVSVSISGQFGSTSMMSW